MKEEPYPWKRPKRPYDHSVRLLVTTLPLLSNVDVYKRQLKADEAIVVENAPLGVEAGHNAGIFTIAVNTGPLAVSYTHLDVYKRQR